jgi:hypothetical protein
VTLLDRLAALTAEPTAALAVTTPTVTEAAAHPMCGDIWEAAGLAF